jgi:hypothetical protein
VVTSCTRVNIDGSIVGGGWRRHQHVEREQDGVLRTAWCPLRAHCAMGLQAIGARVHPCPRPYSATEDLRHGDPAPAP